MKLIFATTTLTSLIVLSIISSVHAMATPSQTTVAVTDNPIVLKTMGSLFFGGTVEHLKDGTTFHGDHGYAQFYIPAKSRTYPIILWHGGGQSGKSWETTPDGREGFQALLPRDNWSIYIIDQPRRGRAGRTSTQPQGADNPTNASEAGTWYAFRLGHWDPPGSAVPHPGIQFPLTGEAINQFMRQQTADTGPLPRTDAYRRILAKTAGDLFRRTGPAILVTHSNSGQFGWYTAMANPNEVKALVAFEPSQLVLPEGWKVGESLTDHPLAKQNMAPQYVPPSEFKVLTKMPILLIYGDNIPKSPSTDYSEEGWRVSYKLAHDFVEAVNANGGDATLISLPKIGIKGNTNAAFADLNNREIQKIVTDWLEKKNLAGYEKPYTGPRKVESEITIPLAK